MIVAGHCWSFKDENVLKSAAEATQPEPTKMNEEPPPGGRRYGLQPDRGVYSGDMMEAIYKTSDAWGTVVLDKR